ncbi:MAG: hypothetical protein HYR84_01350, partial [Planctomycetes bacterium]|nr:hypothetical protein [Planctomycetota bacterium]
MTEPANYVNEARDDPMRRRWWIGGAVALLIVSAVVATIIVWMNRSAPSVASAQFPVAPLPASPYRNTGAEARYVGMETCRSCHKAPHRSYHATGMGRSMAEVDVAREPPDAVVDHPLSKRRYEVKRKDGELWHRELLLAGQAEEVVLCEYPLKYVVGSGRHSLTYLVETDGFLVESPVTWYTSKKAWAMSPGYDDPKQPGFQRGVGEDCLICHAGQAHAIEGSWHKMRVTEPAIGCERCHGPGSIHVDFRRKRQEPPGAIDYTIVNPAHLSRELAEAVCQQCHLRPMAVVIARGRKAADFRPGLPLAHFKQPYMLDEESEMTVVGHVEQMHLSRCFQKSDTFSCLTCHNPHAEPKPDKRDAYYQAICTNCHAPEKCKVSAQVRSKESPSNNCVHCHMPRAPTEIPHLAFTHHRVGIHQGAGRKPAAKPSGELKAFFDLGWLSEIDRKRSQGIGYLEAAEQEKDAARRVQFLKRAHELLTAVRDAGMKDAIVDATLASLHSHLGMGEVGALAESALAFRELEAMDRCNALSLLATDLGRERNHEKALDPLRQLIQWRRHPIDWLRLADCE